MEQGNEIGMAAAGGQVVPTLGLFQLPLRAAGWQAVLCHLGRTAARDPITGQGSAAQTSSFYYGMLMTCIATCFLFCCGVFVLIQAVF